MMAVVKADGYGHGMVESARAAREAGADWLGVATLDEALALRAAGDDGPAAVLARRPRRALRRGRSPATSTSRRTRVAELDEIAAGRATAGIAARLQLKVDTGLSRGGAAARRPGRRCSPRPAPASEAATGGSPASGRTSPAATSRTTPPTTSRRPASARRSRSPSEAGLRPEVRHLANSAAALLRPSARFDLVRCGIASTASTRRPATPPTSGWCRR